MEKKSICLVSSQFLPHVGGVENYVDHLSRGLAERGHEVTIVTSLSDGLPEYEKNGNIEIYRLPSYQFMNGRFPVLKKGKRLKQLKSQIMKKHYDIMLVNMRFYFISLWALKLAKKMGVRAVMLDHGSSHLNTGGKLTSKLGELFEHWITAREKRYCKEFAGVSRESLRWIKHFGIESDILLPNAVDDKQFSEYIKAPVRSFREEYGIPKDDIVISFVGRLTLEKGIKPLVNVVKRINESRRDVWLFAAGGGYLYDELSNTKSENTHLIGQVPSSEVAALLKESDIFCLPSFSEGFPTCVLEAIMCGSYIVTTQRGDAKEIVKDREYGIILPDNNEEGLYNALVSVLDEREHRENAVKLCYDIVINNYTWDKVTDNFISFVDKKGGEDAK